MDNEISILIIEDQILIAHTLKLLLKDLGYHIAGSFYTYETALHALRTADYDLVISDINLGEGTAKRSGITLMTHLRKIRDCPFIFLTAFGDRETVREAAACAPSAYLVKPINEMNLYAAVQLAIENFRNRNSAEAKEGDISRPDFFFVKLGTKLVKIFWRDIDYLEATKNYVKICTAEYKTGVPVRGSLQHVLTSMMPENVRPLFVRINRSVSIAKDSIKEIGEGFVITSFGRFECSADLRNKGFTKY